MRGWNNIGLRYTSMEPWDAQLWAELQQTFNEELAMFTEVMHTIRGIRRDLSQKLRTLRDRETALRERHNRILAILERIRQHQVTTAAARVAAGIAATPVTPGDGVEPSASD